MPEQTVAADPTTDAQSADTTDSLVTEDVLVEEVSIDGMCGVY